MFELGLAEGRQSFAKELLEKVKQDQKERQVETINVIELENLIKEMGVVEK